ncbi:hypothetical protein, conserved [Eimeria praecox]|uniref:Uncharacterized protein n=1 Tax=Eimeria praecox TaxID=51316 RepID=U6H5E9_9EIME|nr:hypothetical protein, conserved [Eimeria praecox]
MGDLTGLDFSSNANCKLLLEPPLPLRSVFSVEVYVQLPLPPCCKYAAVCSDTEGNIMLCIVQKRIRSSQQQQQQQQQQQDKEKRELVYFADVGILIPKDADATGASSSSSSDVSDSSSDSSSMSDSSDSSSSSSSNNSSSKKSKLEEEMRYHFF